MTSPHSVERNLPGYFTPLCYSHYKQYRTCPTWAGKIILGTQQTTLQSILTRKSVQTASRIQPGSHTPSRARTLRLPCLQPTTVPCPEHPECMACWGKTLTLSIYRSDKCQMSQRVQARAVRNPQCVVVQRVLEHVQIQHCGPEWRLCLQWWWKWQRWR